MEWNRHSKRRLVSLLTLFGFLMMSLTGVVLFVMPEGRVAYWVLWEFGGLSKTDWGNMHILSSMLFILAGAFHMYFNWKPLVRYFKDRLRGGLRIRWEIVVACACVFWILASALKPFPPLSYLLDLNSWIKGTWAAEDDYEPPFGHAELMPLRSFCKKMDIDPESASRELQARGIQFENDMETLEEIARANAMSPMNLYRHIKKLEPAPEPLFHHTPESIEIEFSGIGIGNRKLRSVCERMGLDPDLAMRRMIRAGISADLDQTLKSIADAADTQPLEIMKVLLIDGYDPQ